jgi:hypothetical protein
VECIPGQKEVKVISMIRKDAIKHPYNVALTSNEKLVSHKDVRLDPAASAKPVDICVAEKK